MKVCKAPKHIHQTNQPSNLDLNNMFIGNIQIDSVKHNRDIRTAVDTGILVVTKPHHRRYRKVMFKLNTGAQANVLPKWQYKSCSLQPTSWNHHQ